MPRTKLPEEIKDIAIETYSKCGVLADAAKVAGVSRNALYMERKHNKKFRDALAQAKDSYTDVLETELHRRIFDKKEKMAPVLLMFKLKAQMPDVYRDRIDHKVDGNIKIITGIPRPPAKKEEK